MNLQSIRAGIQPHFGDLTLDFEEIKRRVLRRPTLGEVFAIGLCLAMTGISIWLDHTDRVVLYDFDSHMNINHGDFSNYFYPKWVDPLYNLLSFLPYYAAYSIFILMNLAGTVFSARVFKNPAALVLLSYQMLYNIYYGNITGLVVGGLGILWFGLASRKWWLAGIGLLLAAAKYQSGMVFAVLLLMYSDLPWKDKWKVLIVPLLVFLATLAADPFWPAELLERIMNAPPNADGSISLWRWLGPLALVFLIPPLLFNISREHRLLMSLAAFPLVVPYFQQTDLLGLMVLPIGWLAVLGGNISLSYTFLGHLGLQIAFIMPLGLYLYALINGLRRPSPRTVEPKSS